MLFPYYRILSWGSNLGSVQFRVVVTDKPKREEGIDPLSPPKNPPCPPSNKCGLTKGGFHVYNGASSRKAVQRGAGQEESAPGKEKAQGSVGEGEKAKRDDSTDEASGKKEPPPPPPPPAAEVTLQKQKTVTIAFLTLRGKDIETKIMKQVKLLMSKMDSKVRGQGYCGQSAL